MYKCMLCHSNMNNIWHSRQGTSIDRLTGPCNILEKKKKRKHDQSVFLVLSRSHQFNYHDENVGYQVAHLMYLF